jgi:propanediol dehydratase large subunit
MTVRPAVRCVAVSFEVGKQNRPKPFPAGVNKGLREMLPENVVAILLDFEQGIFGHCYRRRPAILAQSMDSSPKIRL